MRRPSLLAAVLCILAGRAGAQRRDAWEVIGPGGGGSMYLPTISPVDPTLVLVGCDMTGSYLSRDGGTTWHQFDLRGRPQFFVFDPVDSRVMYAQGIGLWRSTDEGRSWSLFYPDPRSVTGVERSDDHSSEALLVGGRRAPQMTALGIDPADNRRLYAAIREESRNGFYLSTDGGVRWTKSGDLAAEIRQIHIDPSSPRGDRTVYLIGPRGVSVWQGGRQHTGGLPAGVTAFEDFSAGFPQGGGPPVVYAITENAAYASPDGGVTWKTLRLPGEARFQAVATSLHAPDVAYLSYHELRVPEGPFFGVARTADCGETWSLVWKERHSSAANIQDVWLSERFGPGWGGSPFNLGVAPDNPNVCFGTDSGRTMRTTDGGKTWQGVYSRKIPGGGYTTTGLDVTTNYGVHFDPFDPHRMLIDYTDIGLFRSEDGGQSWVSSTAGVPDEWVNTTYWLTFDPEVRGRVWGVMSGTHDLPRPKMWRSDSTAGYSGGVCRSEDGGRTWRVSNKGMPETAATHIVLDPRSPQSARVLYVTGFGRGVYKSTDGGESWILKNKGLVGSEPFAWRLAQDGAGVLYLVVARRSEDGRIGDAGDGALYRSTDGAGNWEKLPLPNGVNGPNGIAIDPHDPHRLYLAAWGRKGSTRGTDGGIFLSADGGRNWRQVFAGDQHVYDVTVDERSPITLYACGFESSAWRSTDRGETWHRIAGYNFKWGHRVVPDPLDRMLVYITSYGGSVWHGPDIPAGSPLGFTGIPTH